jgi:hypothetical protein
MPVSAALRAAETGLLSIVQDLISPQLGKQAQSCHAIRAMPQRLFQSSLASDSIAGINRNVCQ